MVLPTDRIDAWLDPALTDKDAALRLITGVEYEPLQVRAVSTAVNKTGRGASRGPQPGGEDRAAMHALANAERAAPQHFRFNPVARNLVQTLIERARRRAVAEEFTRLARSLGLDPV